MKKLPFFDEYQYINSALNPKVIKIDHQPYVIDIYVSNLIPYGNKTYPMSKVFFNKERFKISNDPEMKALKISLPRVDVPTTQFGIQKILPLLNNGLKKSWALGINDYGPVEFEISKLTHALVVGSSGFGKSSFFKLLLAQTLKNHPDVVNFIIDPKMVDYSLYADHPSVAMVADSKEKWTNLFYLLLVEIEVRKEVFSKAFKRSPSDINEYHAFREANKRDDLPDFKRFIIWIDEYHILNNQTFHSSVDVEKDCLGYIARMGRAFGIHIVGSSQSYTDFPSDVKNQASTIFSFYSTVSYLADHPVSNQLLAIPGRLNFTYGKEVTENIQAPFLSQEDGLRIAFSGIEEIKEKISPFYRLNIQNAEDLGREFIMGLIQGVGLYKKLAKRSSTVKISDEIFRSHHNIVKIADPQETGSKASNGPVDDLFAEFDRTLSTPSNSAKVKTILKAPPEESGFVEQLIFKQSQNGMNLKRLAPLQNTQTELNLDWCIIDDSKNFGLELCYDNLLDIEGQRATDGPIIEFDKLALSFQSRQTLLKYILEMEQILPTHGSSPVLIIKGKEGMGKRTILRCIAHLLGLGFRAATNQDYLRIRKGSEAEKDELLVFDSIQQIKDFYTQPVQDLHSVVLIDPSDDRAGNIFSVSEIKYLKTYYFFIDLDQANFSNLDVLDALLRSIYSKYAYDFSSGLLGGDILSLKGVPLIPGKIDSLVSRASKRCQVKNTTLNYNELLSEVNLFESLKDPGAHGAVKIITPVFGIDDLILPPAVKGQVQDVILMATNLGKKSFKFHEKLRKNSRLISLFHGVSGSGKSMAAEAIAKELGKELWAINFADLQSCYVGQTEKIMSSLFERASLSGQVLLFDECEVFLGNRDKERDEYMSRIINHILNLFESFSGILILTTNYGSEIDKAFARRIDVKIEFPLPTLEGMTNILSTILLPDAPMEEALDGNYIFKDLSLSGGLIRNGVERLVQKKIGLSVPWTISNSELRQTMLQIYEENELASSTSDKLRKRIGLKKDEV